MTESTTKKSACVVINPISGGKNKGPILEIINRYFPKHIQYEIFHLKANGQDELTKKIRSGNFDIVVAAGGDGTINQVAQAVIGTQSALAIIPLGSGNGLARHLNIPLDTKGAVELIGTGREIKMDACTVNNNYFFCTSGIGFDALIGKLFAESKVRGFFTYLKLTVTNFFNYKPQPYNLIIDGKTVSTYAFLVTFANASQYGNDAFIAPQADISDGFIDVVILKPFRIWNGLALAIKIFNKTLHTSKFVDVHKGQHISVARGSSGPVHFDGEPSEMEATVHYQILHKAVKVLVP